MRRSHSRILAPPKFSPDRPIHDQVAAHLRGLISAGAIGKQARMPAQRNLARDFNVSRNTIIAAYEQLRSEGVLKTKKGAGTFVTAHSQRVSPRLESPKPTSAELPFHQGILDLDIFPRAVWRTLQEKIWRTMPPSMLGHNDAAGLPALRLVLAQRAWATRGVRRGAENVFICSSSAGALQLACKALRLARKEIVVECPGYVKTYSALRACEARLRPMHLDRDGMVVPPDNTPSAAVATPSCQFPMGVTMSSSRRTELLKWARGAGAWIIEDDYQSDFWFEGEPPAALAGEAGAERVLYLTSLNSVMFPSLQIAALIVPDSLVDAFRRAIENTVASTNTTAQLVAHEFINEGHLAAHIRRSKELYSERRSLLRSLLKSEFGEMATLCLQPAGLHATVLLKNGGDRELEERAARNNLVVHSLNAVARAVQENTRAGLYLGFAAFPKDIIQRCVTTLRALMR